MHLLVFLFFNAIMNASILNKTKEVKVWKNKKTRRVFFALKGGYISIYILIATSVAVTLLTGLVIFVTGVQKRSYNEMARNKALQIAESGVYYYQWYLAHNLDGKNVIQIRNFWEGSPLGVDAPYEAEVAGFFDEAIGRYKLEVEPPDPDSTIVVLTSTGWTYRHPEIKKSVKVRFRRPSWSEYSVLGNDMLRFGEDTNIYGPVHSNNGIRFDGIANNLIMSAVEEYYDPDTKDYRPGVWTSQPDESAVFLAGKDFPVPSIDFNGVIVDLFHMEEEAQSGGLYFGGESYQEENCRWKHGSSWCGGNFWCWVCASETVSIEGYHITLRPDDKMEVRYVEDYQGDSFHEPKTYKISKEGEPIIFDIPSSGLVFCADNVWVDGQIDTAKVTIVSAKLESSDDTSIYINDNILYTNRDGRDVIGLVAEKDISIGLFSANDLEIDAALLAQKGRVGRDYYTESQSNAFYKRDQITVYGSIATNERYGFAWTDGTGYQMRNLYFDNNLLYYPPPYFPTGNVYELDLWEDL